MVGVVVIHSEDEQIVRYADAGPLSAKLLKNGRLRTYKDLPHGCAQTHPEIVNADLLAFIRGEDVGEPTDGQTVQIASQPVPAE